MGVRGIIPPMFLPGAGLVGGYLMARLLVVFRAMLGTGWAEALVVLTGLTAGALWWAPWRGALASPSRFVALPVRLLALMAIGRVEPAALAIPAMLGQMAVVALAWTSRPLRPHALETIRPAEALGAIAFSVVVTLAVLDTWGGVPLGAASVLCLGFHWYWHERTGGATPGSLLVAGEWVECAALLFSAWLF